MWSDFRITIGKSIWIKSRNLFTLISSTLWYSQPGALLKLPIFFLSHNSLYKMTHQGHISYTNILSTTKIRLSKRDVLNKSFES